MQAQYSLLSDSRKDSAWVDWLHSAFEHFQLPRHIRDVQHLESKRPATISKDQQAPGATSSLGNTICNALEKSNSLIIARFANTAKSR